MRILINDHAGQPFQVELRRSLAARGHEVLRTFAAGLHTPRDIAVPGGVDCWTTGSQQLLNLNPIW